MATSNYGQYGKQTPGIKGLSVGDLLNIEGRKAATAIDFGDAVFYKYGDAANCYKPYADRVAVTLSGALVASNVITSVVTIYPADGDAVTSTVQNTLATDSATTITAHIALLEALDNLTSAEVTGDHNFSVSAATGYGVSIVTTVTLGAGQVTASYAYTNATAKFGGIAGLMDRSFVDSHGEYPKGDMVNVCYNSTIVVELPVALSGTNLANYAAYVDFNQGSTNYGKFTNSSTNTYDVGGVFKTNPYTAADSINPSTGAVTVTKLLAEVEVGGLK